MKRISKFSLGLNILFLLILSLAGIIHDVQAAVTIVSFNALPGDQQVILEWETASETDMLGFYVTRNDQLNGNFIRISKLIFTQGSSVSGLVYKYIDSNLIIGETYYYKLEALDNNYESEFFGLVSAIPMQISPSLTNTVTKTSAVEIGTETITPTRTIFATIDQIRTQTPSLSPTSPFSFNTNTPTVTFTETARISPTITRTETPDLTLTPEITRTYKIISYNVFTPTETPVPEEISPFNQGLVGFMVTLIVGLLLITILIMLQRKRPSG